jgi:hypothetical protein
VDKQGVSKNDIHLIGLSLGAQLAGYVGKEVPGIRRITGNMSVDMSPGDWFKNIQFRPTQGRSV